jgi:hypothetical protein
MIKHITKIFDDFPEDIGKTASSPASDHVFKVRDVDKVEKLGLFLDRKWAK